MIKFSNESEKEIQSGAKPSYERLLEAVTVISKAKSNAVGASDETIAGWMRRVAMWALDTTGEVPAPVGAPPLESEVAKDACGNPLLDDDGSVLTERALVASQISASKSDGDDAAQYEWLLERLYPARYNLDAVKLITVMRSAVHNVVFHSEVQDPSLQFKVAERIVSEFERQLASSEHLR